MAPKDVSLRRSLGLTVGALGVVFGDIGTSPLYAMRETAVAVGGHAASPAAVYGGLSLILWALVIVVTVKYVGFIMRADNNGEGGVMALAALAHRSPNLSRRVKTAIGIVALAGLALFYGDGMLTPAVSVAAFPAEKLQPDHWPQHSWDWMSWAEFSYPFNLSQVPAASIPCGFTAAGLPVGLQIVGRRFDDLGVLQMSAAFEAARPWASLRPPIA